MKLLSKVKETSMSVLPIVLIVFILNLTIAPIGWSSFGIFSLGALSIIIGLTLFLIGLDISIVPTGHNIGSSLMIKRNLPLLISVGFIIGLFVTVADPQVQVFANQVTSLAPHIAKTPLIWAFGIGIGFFVALSFARIIFKIPYKYLIIFFYTLMVAVSFAIDPFFVGIAFDAGGATTGPLTVPLIIAFGVGMASVRRSSTSEQDSFGLVGLSALGPIAALLTMGLISKGNNNTVSTVVSETNNSTLGSLIGSTTVEVLQALIPLLILFIIFEVTLLHQKRRQKIRMVEGLIYVTLGLIFFLVGVNGAFMPIGSKIGSTIGRNSILIPIGLLFGAVIVLAEPAVWVLTNQVNEVSGGTIKKRLVLIFFSIGISIAVGLAMVRIIYRLPLFYLLLPGYALAMLLSFFTPPLFTAIAYDSGAVASGPMSASFLIAFTLGASTSGGGDPFTDGFGMMALIVMTPMVTLQLLGLIYKRQKRGEK